MRRVFRLLLTALVLAGCSPGHREPAPADPPAASHAAVPAQPAAEAPSPDLPGEPLALVGHAGLRYDCEHDSDCAIKDIGNCCGAYPSCVHVDSTPDPDAVARECASKGLAGICGYPVISACECRAGRCQGVNEPIGDEAER